MSQPPYDYSSTVPYQGVPVGFDRDREHLKILSICWYVFSGLAALMGSIPLIHVTVGIIFIVGSRPGGGPGPPPAIIGWLFVIIGGLLVLFGWTVATLAFFAARSLSRRRRIMLCYIAAALACINVPIGTTLGVFTFVVLARPGIKSSFS